MNSFIFLFSIVIAALLAFFFVERRLPYWKGQAGERAVAQELFQLDEAHYKVLNNLLLPSGGNLSTTQIDHVVVSNYGIFCIETKTYKGWIFGSANQKYWTQVIFRRKEKFYNPLWQNYAHVKAVEGLVKPKYSKARIFSLVAFCNADKLKISGTDSVVFARDLARKIESFANVIFSDAERDEIYEILTRADAPDKEAHKLHDQSVRELRR